MSCVIRIVERADGSVSPEADLYLESCRHEGNDGRGQFGFTHDIRAAMQFATHGEAFEYWKRQSRVNPIRPDGRPNRPLTAYTIMIEGI